MASYKELKGYIKAFDLAMEIFQITKSFPDDERYGLISQIRRSSRSVCSNIADELNQKAEKTGRILNYMIRNPMKFIR